MNDINEKYFVPSRSVTTEQEIKKSKFITSITRASNSKKAKEFIQSISSKYSDASHNCYAFVAGNPFSTNEIGFGDDGEVAGTAGKPILSVLQHKKIGEIVVVVTRYFGGTKLGTGGLVRAYSSSVQFGLDKLELIESVPFKHGKIEFSYEHENQVQQLLRQLDVEITNINYSQTVELFFDIPLNLAEKLSENLGNVTKGQVKIKWI